MNERVVVTRTAVQAPELGKKLAAAGFVPVYFPAIQLEPLPPTALDAALAELGRFAWLLFTSGNGVDFFLRWVRALGLPITPTTWPQIAAVGEATAVKLQTAGLPVQFIPEQFTGEALAHGLGDLRGQKVLLPRAAGGRPEIAALLLAQGAELVEVALYETITAVPTSTAWATLQQGFEVVSFTSPSSVRNFMKLIAPYPALQKQVQEAHILCIGPVTADTAVAQTLPTAHVPDQYTIAGMVALLQKMRDEG